MRQAGKKGKQTHSILNIIGFFLKPYKLHITALFILFLLVGGLEAATIAAVYPILNAAFDSGTGQGNIVLSLFGTMANMLPIADEFISYCVLFLILALLAFAVKLISVNFRIRFAASLVKKNQSEIFNKLIKADYQYFIDHKQGELIYNASTAPEQISSLVSGVTELISQTILSISVILLLFSLSWPAALAVLVLGVGYQYFAKYFGKKVSYISGKGAMEALRESNVILNESISGIKQVKVFDIGENWADSFRSAINRRWYHSVRRSLWGQTPPILLILILYLAIGIVAMLIKIMVPTGFTELIPAFGAFAFALFRLFPFIGTVGGLIMSIMGAIPDCEAVYAVQSGKLTYIEDGKEELSSFKSDIKFENVSFSHRGRAKTMRDVSVTFKKGKTTAIVGRSGGGKTTLINLLLRLFDVDQGEIKIDGVNIKEYKLASWLKNVGFVSQDTFILNDTVENNITFGSAGYSHEEVIKATKYADADGFINALPNGYDTLVGDKGMRLSGGQGQRIAVARAMVRNPEVLIFDEATNNLDNISEVAVQKAIDEISKKHTVIIIAHRLSTIANADKIIVLEDGRVVEEGVHKELMEKKGAYWQLYQSQPL